MQRKVINNSFESNRKSLSIQFSLGGFSFCVVDVPTKTPIFFAEYEFVVANPQELLQKIEAIFISDKNLQQDFESIKVIHQNNLATIVPTSFFDENNLKSYLDYTIKTLATDFVTFDTFKNITAKNVYIPYVNINNYLFQNFGEFEYQHHSTCLIDKLLHHTKNTNEKQFFVYVFSTHLDIVVTQKQDLLFYNSFEFTTKEDFIYYLLFVMEQLQLNSEECKLTFLGAIEKDSEIYKITYNYVRHIYFIETKSSLFTNSTDFSSHSNYILVS